MRFRHLNPAAPWQAAEAGLARLRHGVDDFMAGPPEPEAYAEPNTRTNRRLLWLDGLVSNASESFVTSFIYPFAMALGATNGQIGTMSALTNLGAALGLMPGARLADRFGRKQVAVLTGGVAGRLLLLVLAALPLLLKSSAAIYAIIAVVVLRSLAGQLGFPAWSALVADLAPRVIRGRYFAARNIGLAIAALLFTPLAGRIIDLGGGMRGYQVAFVIAGLVGFGATTIFAHIKDPPTPLTPSTPAEKAKPGPLLTLLRSAPRFTAFTGVAFIWNLALMIMGPFFSVYLVRDLGATPTLIGILAAVNSLGNIVGQWVWGRLNDRRGAAWVMRVTGLAIPVVPLAWSLAPGPWWLLPVEWLSGFLWAGYGLASFNLLLSLTPEAQRARFVAIYQMSVFGSAFVGPLLGSVLANALTIRPLLWISAGGRLVAALLFLFTVRSDTKMNRSAT
ncbi:MAG: hypothetical protein CVU38_06265 [Chloroflexi bacterium HGW-Chloroflexi-1]|nr:MAG: hypothetical protein CVU38_06265 [Chloroflexi bacterium HGW-Chloroflexi-1]